MDDRILSAEDFVEALLDFDNSLSPSAVADFKAIAAGSFDTSYCQSVIVPLGGAKAYIDQLPNNWLYDRRSGLVWINLTGGQHTPMMAALYCLHTRLAEIDVWPYPKADSFVNEGHGMFLSSIADSAYKGVVMRLTSQERTVFSSACIRDMRKGAYVYE